MGLYQGEKEEGEADEVRATRRSTFFFTDLFLSFLASLFTHQLISILAWSAMHLSDSGEPWSEIADVATSDASERVQQALREREKAGAGAGGGRRGSDVPVTGKDEELLAGLALLSEIEVSMVRDEEEEGWMVGWEEERKERRNERRADLRLLFSVQICRGSTQNWFTPLKLAQQIIRGLGGPKKLQTMSGNGLWLLRNIAYHELLVSLALSLLSLFVFLSSEAIADLLSSLFAFA